MTQKPPQQPSGSEGTGTPFNDQISPIGKEMGLLRDFSEEVRARVPPNPGETVHWTADQMRGYGLQTDIIDDTHPVEATMRYGSGAPPEVYEQHGDRGRSVEVVEEDNARYEPVTTTHHPGDSVSLPEQVYLPFKENLGGNLLALINTSYSGHDGSPLRLAVGVRTVADAEGRGAEYTFSYVDSNNRKIGETTAWNPGLGGDIAWEGIRFSVSDDGPSSRHINLEIAEDSKPHTIERMHQVFENEIQDAHIGNAILSAVAPDAVEAVPVERGGSMRDLEQQLHILDEKLAEPYLIAASKAYDRRRKATRDQRRFYQELHTDNSDLSRRYGNSERWLENESSDLKSRINSAENVWISIGAETRDEVLEIQRKRSVLESNLRQLREQDIAERYNPEIRLDTESLSAMKGDIVHALKAIGDFGVYTSHANQIVTVMTKATEVLGQWKGDNRFAADALFISNFNPIFRTEIIKPIEAMPARSRLQSKGTQVWPSQQKPETFDQIRDRAPRGATRPSRAHSVRELIGNKTIRYHGDGLSDAHVFLEAAVETMIYATKYESEDQTGNPEFVLNDPSVKRDFILSLRRLLSDANQVDSFK